MAEQDKSTKSLAATCRIFISYSHDSLEHQKRVLALANQLRQDGVEAWIDQYTQDPNEGWIQWMRSQVRQASRVLLVFTKTYQRRFEGDEEEGKGLGATFEGVIVTQALYESGGRNAKFRPVVFSEQEETFISAELRQFNRYRVDTPEGYEYLLRWLREAPRIVAPPVGPNRDLPSEPASELFPRDALEQAKAGDKINIDLRGSAEVEERSVIGLKADEIGGDPHPRPVKQEGTRLYTVWYGTNRQALDPNDPSRGFSGQRSEKVNYGTCAVAIPRSHKFGSVGSSWWKRLLALTDDRLYVRELQPQNHSEFWASIRSAVAERSVGERHAVLYLHGYNTSFDEAAIRAAQIGFDLKVPGVMAFFSWPSQGSVRGYIADEASIENSEGVITDFMVDLATKSGAKNVHVIAHSMGNRGLLRALQRIEARVKRRSKVRFGQIFLAAPDIDAALFESLAYLYPRLSKRTTLYVSPADKALGAST